MSTAKVYILKKKMKTDECEKLLKEYEEEKEENDMADEKFSVKITKLVEKYYDIIERGDVVSIIADRYRNDNTWIWNGVEAIPLAIEKDEYGHVPKEFWFPEFPIEYWSTRHDAQTGCYKRENDAPICHNAIIPIKHVIFKEEILSNLRYLGKHYDWTDILVLYFQSHFTHENQQHRVFYNFDDIVGTINPLIYRTKLQAHIESNEVDYYDNAASDNISEYLSKLNKRDLFLSLTSLPEETGETILVDHPPKKKKLTTYPL